MPRAAKTKSRLHSSAVSLPSKLKGFPEPSVQPDVTASFPTSDAEPSSSRGSKLNPLPPPRSGFHPYIAPSKSHARREKRKAKSHLGGNDLSSLETALALVIPSTEDPEDDIEDDKKLKKKVVSKKSKEQIMKEKEEERRRAVEREKERGKIGEGRGKTLGEKKRREAVQDAAKRIPAVMVHPAYKQNPWAAIREHVGNTVAVKEKPMAK
ncbi:hypothetical protein CI109_103645 [Kwoniella shandongensis]|uniref:Ribosome biogenesis protein SLX9 n=1 Tax=Kwoniella shandongensis TaxID=1734106 RepID=A0A5M6C871_9TREE|nr:uncharacterized protein CI109_000663 [Kwoniella shandongensis]KAA5531091.1 hypothetical protein CI109_000663 [Kwoniella shandongensis]